MSDSKDGIVTHMVMLKVKDEATTQQKDDMIAQLLNLKNTVPGVLDVKAGESFTTARNKGFNYAISVTLESKAALSAYGPHPNHQTVRTTIQIIYI